MMTPIEAMQRCRPVVESMTRGLEKVCECFWNDIETEDMEAGDLLYDVVGHLERAARSLDQALSHAETNVPDAAKWPIEAKVEKVIEGAQGLLFDSEEESDESR